MMKMKHITCVLVAAVIVVGAFIFIPSTVQANSCKCDQKTGTFVKTLDFKVCSNDATKNCDTNTQCGTGNTCASAPYKDCKPDILSSDCYAEKFGWQSSTTNLDVAAGEGGFQGGAQVTTVVCKSYRDNLCQEAAGTPVSSPFSRCWTKQQCEADGKGTWDEAGKNKGECQPLGNIDTARCFIKAPSVPLQIGIPGVTDKFCSVYKNGEAVSCKSDESICTQQRLGQCRPGITGGFPGYLAQFYKFFIAMLAVSSVVIAMWGGFKRILAAGNAESIKNANDTIFGAITGLILALVSYSLLQLINPALVTSTILKLDKVKPEVFGNWCPDPDPSDSSKHYECGDKVTVNNQPCIGMVCGAGNGGCYKVGNSDDKKTAGKSPDYQCLQPQDACKAVTLEVAQTVHGLPSPEYKNSTAYWNLCSRFSSGENRCIWLSMSVSDKEDGKCLWLDADRIKQVCNSHLTCQSMDDLIGPGSDFAAFCGLDICGRNCIIELSTGFKVKYLFGGSSAKCVNK